MSGRKITLNPFCVRNILKETVKRIQEFGRDSEKYGLLLETALRVSCHVVLGSLDICWCWTNKFYQDQSHSSCQTDADKIYGGAGFVLQQDLATEHTAQSTRTHFNDHHCACIDTLMIVIQKCSGASLNKQYNERNL